MGFIRYFCLARIKKRVSALLVLLLLLEMAGGAIFPFKLSLKSPYISTQKAFASGESWYNSSWPYRKAITITGSTAGAQTNYQVNVNVTYSSNMKSDFSDIRFTDSDGTTLLNQWMESDTASTSASFWVKIPSIPASPSTTTIYMYYGNASAVSASSGDNTFNFFDDFNNVLSSNPVMKPSQAWELSGTPSNRWGSIAYLNGTYYIYYVNESTTYGVGRATSTDLKTWVKDGSNPIIT